MLEVARWMNFPNLLTTKQAADLSGYHREHIERIVRQGKIKAEKIDGIQSWLIDREDFQAYVTRMKALGSDKYNPHRALSADSHAAPKKRKTPKARVAFKAP